jgi:membrane protein YqaA with SNARE-associated domain
MTRIEQILNRSWRTILYYQYKGYYHFIGGNVLKIGFLYFLVIISLVLIGKNLLDLNQLYHQIASHYSDTQVLILFFVTESILGPIPPDFFMMWSAKFTYPVWMLTLLGFLSYLGGIVSYKMGEWLFRRKKIKNFVEKRLKRYVRLTKKWGGAFITIAALFPFTPYASVILAVSLLKYPFKKLLLFGTFRIIRFIVQGMVLIEVLNLNI